MISCKASEAPELYNLSILIAAFTNTQCHFDLKDIPEEKRLVELDSYIEQFIEIVG